MKTEKAKLLLMPLCVLLGTALLFAFVSFSHSYLSEYFVRNSKNLIGQKIDLAKLSEHLGDSRLLGFSQAHSTLNTKLVFWSLSCSPCLEKLSKSKAVSSQDLIFPINVDDEASEEEATQILNQLAPQYSFYRDSNGFMLKHFQIDYLPTYITIDSKGFIVDVKAGPSVEL